MTETVTVLIPDGSAGGEIICGTLARRGHRYFRFSYNLRREDAFTLSPHDAWTSADESWHEYPPYVLSDAETGAWGRRILAYAGIPASHLTFQFCPVRERIGAIAFAGTLDEGLSTTDGPIDLETSLALSQRIETDGDVHSAKALAPYVAGVGGARPKALTRLSSGEHAIAKFPSLDDRWPVVACEFLGMRLAALVGIRTAKVQLVDVKGSDVLLVERFDISTEGMERKRHMFSALTALKLFDWEAQHASYPALAAFLSRYSDAPDDDCRELYSRMVFNAIIGNTDDHARNHAVFWDGHRCRLTPAYDLVVFPRIRMTSFQAMIVGKHGTSAEMRNCLSACHCFRLTLQEAREIYERIHETVYDCWKPIAREARIADKMGDSALPILGSVLQSRARERL